MKEPKILTPWDFPDTVRYDSTTVPDLTRDNFEKLVNEYNYLVEVVLRLCQRQNISFEVVDSESKDN